MPDLVQLGEDLRKIDRLIMDLVKRRMDVAQLVAQEKQRTGGVMYRPQIEDQRIAAIGDHARSIGLNPHMARAVLYFLIAESCKEQTILLESQAGAAQRPEAERLKENLLRLTEQVAGRYDERDTASKYASQLYAAYEAELIRRDAEAAGDRALALDLGCATGRVALELASGFAKVAGYDVSAHMIAAANAKAQGRGVTNAHFATLDLDASRLPEADASASFIVMNLGTASDVSNLPHVLGEIARVLKPGGRFFLTFYNADALLYKMGFLPWVASLEAVVNPYTMCLDVKIGDTLAPVHAQLYSEADVRALLPAKLAADQVTSFPEIAAILPDEVLGDDKVRASIDRLDRELARGAGGHGGAYLIVRGRKR
ncbi:MAG: methyltransferase domain-containing protein [Beijerinckiaceae bacterium]